MKKRVLSLIVLSIVCLASGCGKAADSGETTEGTKVTDEIIVTTDNPTEPSTEAPTLPPTVEELRLMAEVNSNQPFLNLFKLDKETFIFNLKHDYSNVWEYYSDIGGFYTFATEETGFEYNGFTDKWFNWWNSFAEASSTKIGYEVIVTLNDDTVMICNVKDPADTAQIFDFVELYLYDDVHQEPGAWYSHLLPEQMTEETLMTSIKVTTGVRIAEVASIYLTVYTYQSDADFDVESGRYIGGNYTGFEIGKINSDIVE